MENPKKDDTQREYKETEDSRHSKFTYASFSTYNFAGSFIIAAQTILLFFFYEAVIGLNIWYVFFAFLIAAIWDATNDPLIGHLIDRNTRLTKRWGRRFPWIVFGIIPWCFSLLLIYMPPKVDPQSNAIFLFIWLAFSLCLFDTFHTLIYVNIVHLRADKFRTEKERRTLAAFFTPIDILGQVGGMLVPPLILSMGEGREIYAIMALMISVITLIASFIFVPGTREDNVMIERYYKREYKELGFFGGLRENFKLKSFIVFMVVMCAFEITTGLLIGNAIYLVTFVLKGGADMVLIVFGLFLLGAIISVPFWVWMAKKLDNNKKSFTIGGFAIVIALIPLSFFQTLIDLLIFTFILGFALGCIWTLLFPVIQPNVLDDFVVHTKKNQKGVQVGLTTFILRLAAVIDELLIAVVHTATGFVAGYDTYEGLAGAVDNVALVLWGIRLLQGIIPMFIMLGGILIFWKFYPLTQDKVKENKRKLEELGF
ncbi:MAG: MFS transporter [Candidatus Lokiarchaeota archaeon]|nr:MFS transporter [Candidatus Lokiarchaeota archaeon]MBD3342466.1 MFS transporter [Candidatus Lokiarchaeota archaeon]